jgi:predicted nucleic acid-binding protein
VILADTSIWIDHLRGRNPEMEKRLGAGQIVTHPYIVAEIALGSLRNRTERLKELDALRQVIVAETREVRHMIEARSLYSRGISLVDAHLLASCVMTPGTLLWTRDVDLEKAARSTGVTIHVP